jgi:hypothetical protein
MLYVLADVTAKARDKLPVLAPLALEAVKLGPRLSGSAVEELDSAGRAHLLRNFLASEETGEDQPENEGRDGEERDCRANFAET